MKWKKCRHPLRETNWHKNSKAGSQSPGGDSVNFYFAPENTPESAPQSTPENNVKNGPFQYCQDYPDLVNIFLAQKYNQK